VLLLDANIMIRGVLGNRVRELLARYSGSVRFVAPIYVFSEVDRNLPIILARRMVPFHEAARMVSVREKLDQLIESVPENAFRMFEEAALLRLRRDPDDWPILAASLALKCPIWTEDMDFFGTGVPTWTTDRVEIYLANQSPKK
jgi:predicted nucleic acid-binding protein